MTPHTNPHDSDQPMVPDLITNLIILDRQTGQPTVAPEGDANARAWLIQVLLDVDCRRAHVERLKTGYGGRFRFPRPHWERPWEDRLVPDPASGFQWFDLLPEDKMRQLFEHGPSTEVLDAGALARLLLNPFALWDLAERLDTQWPAWWLKEMDRRGKAWLKEKGIRLRLSNLGVEGTPPVAGAAFGSLAGVGLMQCRVGLKPPSGNCWELTFGADLDAVGLRRDYAGKLYGNRDTHFTFRLIAHPPEEANAPVPFSLEVEPAPTHGPVTIQLEFPGEEVREFVLEPPETFPGVDAPGSFRSARCAPVPPEAAKFTTITWGDHTDDRHLLRDWRKLRNLSICSQQAPPWVPHWSRSHEACHAYTPARENASAQSSTRANLARCI